MTTRCFLSSEFDNVPPGDARFHVIPVPYEATVSYGGGTAAGPAAILEASDQLEVFDGTSVPGEDGIHTWPPVIPGPTPRTTGDHEGTAARRTASGTADRGRVASDDADPEPPIFEAIRSAVKTALDARDSVVPVILGGEHSITAPAVDAVLAYRRGHARLQNESLGLVQLDAHADLRDSYEGSGHSHACVVRRIHQDMGVPVAQIGVRALSPEEVAYRSGATGLTWWDAAEVVPDGRDSILLPEDFPDEVYLTIDVDGLDPAIMPATGTPVPGGLSWYQTLRLIESVAAQRRIVAFDVVELAPIKGLHAPNYLAADLTYRVMGIIQRAGL